MDKTEGFAPNLFTIHYYSLLKKTSPRQRSISLSGTNFCQNPRYHPRLRETRWVLPSSLRGNGARRQILPRTRGSARSALGSPFARSPSRLHSIGGSLERGGCGTILRHRFMMLYHSTDFLFCQGVLGFFRGKLTAIPHGIGIISVFSPRPCTPRGSRGSRRPSCGRPPSG